ncbi:hypothetical protein KVT40_007681 [Elsinoe batatas]|uniref:Ankyrin repeat-containing protein n=1 Tax=Elsinoe batatas TaxID=2601811 RepID=A0A8K0PGI5_9PEZI|nr:hypothetical protein KVT40_007681 [Elsinoe batatas]
MAHLDAYLTEEAIESWLSHLGQDESRGGPDLPARQSNPSAASLHRLTSSARTSSKRDLATYAELLRDCADNRNSSAVAERITSWAGSGSIPGSLQPLACLSAQTGSIDGLRACLDAGAEIDDLVDKAAFIGLTTVGMLTTLRSYNWRDIQSPEGATRLLTVCTTKPIEIMRSLIESGARASKWNLNAAITSKQPVEKIRLLLYEGGAKEGLKDPGILQLAARHGRADLVDAILEAGAEIDAIPAQGDFREPGPHQALYEAVKHGHVEVAKLLMERGSDPNVDNGKFYLVEQGTARDCARKKGDPEMMRIVGVDDQ